MVIRRSKSLRGGRKSTRSLRGRNKSNKKSQKVKSRNKRKSIRKRRRTGGAAAAALSNNAAAPSKDPLDIFYNIENGPDETYGVLEKIKSEKKFEVNLKNPNENTKNELKWLTQMITPDLIGKIHLVAEKYPEFKKRLDKYTGDDKEDNNDKRVYTSRGTRVGSSLV